MSIYDRWHLTHPENQPGWNHEDPAQRPRPCRCSRGRTKLYPTADHPQPGKRELPRWQVRYRDEDDKQCKRNFAKLGGAKDETDPEAYAKAFDAKVNAELDAGTYIDPAAGEVTLNQFGKEFRDGLVANISSLGAYDRKLAHIYGADSVIASWAVSKLARRPIQIQKWIRDLEGKGLSPNYVRQIVDMLSSIFIAAIDNGLCHRNPTKARSLRLPTATKRKIVPWTDEMVYAARAELAKRKLGGVVDLGFGAGLRQGEIFGIAVEDLDLDQGQKRKVHVRRQAMWLQPGVGKKGALVFAPPKGDKEREVPLSDECADRLIEQMETLPPVKVTLPWKTPDSGETVTVTLLFVRPSGLPYHRNAFGYIWEPARDAAGAEPTPENGMHVLRHTFASVQLAGGVDLAKVSLWLGHADITTTGRLYVHFVPDYDDRGRTVIDAFMRAGAAKIDGGSALDVPSAGRPVAASRLRVVSG